MKLLILRVFLPNEDASADENEYGVVPLTKELAKLILTRRKQLKDRKAKDEDLYESSYWSRDCQFFALETVDAEFALTEEEMDDYRSNDWVIVEREKMVQGEALRMEMIMMRILEGDVRWKAMPKHEDIQIETAPLDYGNLEKEL